MIDYLIEIIRGNPFIIISLVLIAIWLIFKMVAGPSFLERAWEQDLIDLVIGNVDEKVKIPLKEISSKESPIVNSDCQYCGNPWISDRKGLCQSCGGKK